MLRAREFLGPIPSVLVPSGPRARLRSSLTAAAFEPGQFADARNGDKPLSEVAAADFSKQRERERRLDARAHVPTNWSSSATLACRREIRPPLKPQGAEPKAFQHRGETRSDGQTLSLRLLLRRSSEARLSLSTPGNPGGFHESPPPFPD